MNIEKEKKRGEVSISSRDFTHLLSNSGENLLSIGGTKRGDQPLEQDRNGKLSREENSRVTS